MKEIELIKLLLKALKKLRRLKKILPSLVVLISLSNCSVTTDDFELWGEPICYNDATKLVIDERNIDYAILNNRKLKIKKDYCKQLRKNRN